jgi:hypothetical protein
MMSCCCSMVSLPSCDVILRPYDIISKLWYHILFYDLIAKWWCHFVISQANCYVILWLYDFLVKFNFHTEALWHHCSCCFVLTSLSDCDVILCHGIIVKLWCHIMTSLCIRHEEIFSFLLLVHFLETSEFIGLDQSGWNIHKLFYAPTKWEHIALHLSVRLSVRPYVCLSVRPEILWTQLLLNRMADFT